jgi:flagellar basal-body rod modification protein FlgD
MDVTTSAQTTATQTSVSRGARSAESRINSDFDTFLKMLTAQMRNQDPLNPIDSADYAVQLATFSGVEQQMRTNDTLQALLGRMDMQGMAQMAAWVGHEARSTAPVAFQGLPVTIYPPPPEASVDGRVLVVRDAQGTLVAREEMAARAASHDWYGDAMTGGTLPPGTYTLSVESYAGEKLLSSGSPESYAVIDELRASPQGTRAVLAGGAEIATSAITALRRN